VTFGPKTWIVGETVSAALLNQEIRDQWNSVLDPWTTYTPGWTAATTNPVIGNGTLTGRYMKVGRTVHLSINLVGGATTTWGAGAYSFAAPFASANSTVSYLGGARLSGSGSGDTWIGQASLGPNTTSINATFPVSTTNTRASNMHATGPETHAAGSTLRLFVTYQSAT
jgi:hypothetical protein